MLAVNYKNLRSYQKIVKIGGQFSKNCGQTSFLKINVSTFPIWFNFRYVFIFRSGSIFDTDRLLRYGSIRIEFSDMVRLDRID